MKRVTMTKAHGCGNDYLFLDATDDPGLPGALFSARPTLVRDLCDRHTGFGADGVIVLTVEDGVARAEVFNADGSGGGMCGNGLRCAVHLLRRRGVLRGDAGEVRMGGRMVGVRILGAVEGVRPALGSMVALEMGAVDALPGTAGVEEWLGAAPAHIRATLGWIGNPHAVLWLESAPDEGAFAWALAQTTGGAAWPEGVNVSFAVDGGEGIALWTVERGAGRTKACGSAACVAVSGAGGAGEFVKVRCEGGVLEVAVGGGGGVGGCIRGGAAGVGRAGGVGEWSCVVGLLARADRA